MPPAGAAGPSRPEPAEPQASEPAAMPDALPEPEAGAAVTGRVVSPDGEPVANAAVAIIVPGTRWASPGQPQRRQSVPIWQPPLQPDLTTVRSGADGRFVVALRERLFGSHVVLVVPQAPYSPATAPLDVAYVSRFPSELAQPQAPLDVGDVVVPLGVIVEGRVTNEAEEPVAGALVHVDGNNLWGSTADSEQALAAQRVPYARTDANGRYRLAGVPRTRVAIAAEAEGYAQARQNLDADDEEPLDDVDLVLPLVPHLLVVVRDRDGQPIEGARATVHGPSTSSPNAAEAETDAEGIARFEALPLVRLALSVAKLGYRERRVSLWLVPDATVTHEITLSPVTVVSLRPIDSHTGQPIYGGETDEQSSFRSRARTRRSWRNLSVQIEDDGVVHIAQVPTGTAHVELWPSGYQRIEREVALAANESRDLGDVLFDRGVRLLITVCDPAGEPLPDTRLSVAPFEYGPDGREELTGRAVQDYTDEHGQWETPAIGGRYARITVMRTLSRTANGGQWTTVLARIEPLDLSQEVMPLQITVELGEPASVSGFARDLAGAPLVEQTIFLVQHTTDWGRGRTYNATTDERGHFRISPVVAGRYRLTTRMHRTPQDADDWFDVADGEQVMRDYMLTADLVRGQLLWHDGSPAGHLDVALLHSENGEPGADNTTRTDSSGHFTLLEPTEDARQGLYRPSRWLRVRVERERFVVLRVNLNRSLDLGEVRLPPIQASARGTLKVSVVDAHTDAPGTAGVLIRGTVNGERISRLITVNGSAYIEDLPVGRLYVMLSDADYDRVTERVQVAADEVREVVLKLTRRVAAKFLVTFSDHGVASGGQPRIRISCRPLEGRGHRGRTGYPDTTIIVSHLLERTRYEATIACQGYEDQVIRFTPMADDPPTFEVTLTPAVSE